MKESVYEEVFDFVKTIPAGKVLNYGAVGRYVGATARQVGQIMAKSDATIPWWRVVAHDGSYPVSKRDPRYENEQRDRLTAESVPLKSNGKVNMLVATWDPSSEHNA